MIGPCSTNTWARPTTSSLAIWAGNPCTPSFLESVLEPDAAGRVAELSFFFPAHNEAENIEALVDEALTELPKLADEFEIIAVDDGVEGRHAGAIADRLAAEHPRCGWFTTRSTAATAGRCAVASPPPAIARRLHRRRPPVQDRRSRAAARAHGQVRQARRGGRLPDETRRSVHPLGLRPRLPIRAAHLLRPRVARRRLRVQAVPARGPRGHPARVAAAAFLSAELLIKLKQRGRTDRRGRRAALPAHCRVSSRRETQGGDCARSAISGGCVFDCGPTGRLALDTGRTGRRLASRAGGPRGRGRLCARLVGQVEVRASS